MCGERERRDRGKERMWLNVLLWHMFHLWLIT